MRIAGGWGWHLVSNWHHVEREGQAVAGLHAGWCGRDPRITAETKIYISDNVLNEGKP